MSPVSATPIFPPPGDCRERKGVLCVAAKNEAESAKARTPPRRTRTAPEAEAFPPGSSHTRFPQIRIGPPFPPVSTSDGLWSTRARSVSRS